nr:zinc finger CCCH domain-containing protein 13-like isoform X1 [Procambarus clarkii]
MPTVRPTGPPQSHNHLQVPRTESSQVARTESLRSERSDKRVSFNKDVGVKHIPRGQKTAGKGSSVVLVRGGTPPFREDEWANCSQVHREPVSLSSQELEQQAEHLVKLLDHVNCDVNTRSLDRPPKNKNNKNLAHHTYNNVLFNNAKNNNNNSKNTNLLNGEGRARQRTLPPSRTTNPITRRVKGDVNRATHHPIPNGGPLAYRHKSAEHLPDTDLEDSPPLPRRAHHPAAHKSVPDLNLGQYYNNSEDRSHTYQPEGHSYKSVENLYHADGHNLSRAAHVAAYKSADNLADINSHDSGRHLQGFKSLGHLPTEALSDTDDDYDHQHHNHRHHNHQHKQSYKPRVGNIIKMFNQDADELRRHNLIETNEMEAGQRGTLEPDRYRNHNNNQPFSYTGTTPIASVQTVRRLSPPRDLGRPTPPRDTPPRDAPVYAQVNKREGRPPHNNGRRDLDRNYHNSRQEREYSAKIIITQDDHHDHRRSPFHDPYDEHSPYIDTPPKNQYQNDRRDDDDYDDDAYESYQVPEDNLRRLIHDDLEEYKEHSNNNINMSSVGVQTEALPKAPTRSRTRAHKNPASSPTRQPTHQKQPVQKQTLRQQEKQQEPKQQPQPSSYRQSKQQNYFTNQREQQRGETNIHNNLTSASLVRQVNHGFGRTDRSPSPPPRVSATRQPRRNVVPLLSDTSDSEAEYRRPTVDPLARIRDQVMQREKLQEEEEEEEETHLRRPLGPLQESGVMPYRPEEMTPLTIDEVDALSLVMEDTGRKSLVVSNQAQSTTVTRVSNHHHRSRHSETVTEHYHTHEPRDKDSLSRPQKPVREKNQVSREATPTRKGRDTPTHKDPPTIEKNKKNNLEKERASKAAAKHKEEKEKEKEKKKKKKIKIKFFYDPRPQDDPNVDPLANFKEFRGTSSDERASPQDDHRDDRKNDIDDRREEPKVKRHSEEREIRDDYHPQREVRDDYHPQREVRDDYHPQREVRDDYHPQREVHEDYHTQRRGLPDVLEDAAPLRERRVGSRERLEVTPKTNKRIQRDTRDARSSRERSYDSYDYKRRDSKDSRESRDDRSRSRDERISYNESTDERRNHRERDYDNHENDDNEERGSPDGRPGRSLSDKYRTGPLYDPPDNPHKDDPHQDDKNPHPPQPQPPPEEEEKKEKIMRQRNKFLSVLMSDGRNKSSNTKAPNVKTSKTKSSSNTKASNNKPSTTTTATTTKVKSSDPAPSSKSKKGPAPPQPSSTSPPAQDTPDKAKPQAAPAKKKSPKKKRAWPWALLGLRGGGRGASKVPQGTAAPPPGSSRASSRASSRSSHRPRRPSVRASKIRRDGQSAWLTKERQQQREQQQQLEQQQGREKDVSPPPPPWQTSTLNRAELRARKGAAPSGEDRGYSTVQRPTTRKFSAESSASSGGAPPPAPSQVTRTTSFKHRYFGDTDIESNHGGVSAVGDYRSLPNRSSRSTHKNAGRGRRTASGPRGMSPPVVGSAGSSLQSSESEVDSHGGSHASRASRASHVSTGSNRSVYLHATAIADIPVRRGPDDAPSERSISRQTKKVSRSFSLLAPWKPRHYREKFEVEYDNREVREARGPDPHASKGALPPRPPRRPPHDPNDKKVNRSQSVYKDSRLATWLRRRRNKEAKGI